MRFAILACLLAAAACRGDAPRAGTAIEPVAYASSVESAAAWKGAEGAISVQLADRKTPDGQRALAFTCDMSRTTERRYWDRDVHLDLTREDRIALWINVTGDPSAVSSFTLYLKSGKGWYGAPFSALETGWQRLELSRGSFIPEDTPAGWNAVDGIRFSCWRGRSAAATVLVGPIEATSSEIVVVRCTRGGEEAMPWAGKMADLLARAGITAGGMDDTDVGRGALRGRRLAIYPHNPVVGAAEADELRAFVKEGGKLLVCYTLPDPLGEMLGVRATKWTSSSGGRFAAMRFGARRPSGCPAVVHQASWNVQGAEPGREDCRVLADWIDARGAPAGLPAVMASNSGAFVSHVLLDDDPTGKEALARGLVGLFVPGIWTDAARLAMAQVGKLAGWQSYEAAYRGVGTLLSRSPSAAARAELAACSRAMSTARADAHAGRNVQALAEAAQARKHLVAAYSRAQSPVRGEMRAVWCHSPFGVEGMTWDQAAAALRRAGFTAIYPNMLWGGLAHYRSKLLPVDPSVATRGDQIDLCLAAARKHGLQVHVWKVNWNLQNAPDSFVNELRPQGRLQRDDQGKEVRWLCPSHPANLDLERDSMLEVVRNYAVDGIHFDYIRYPDSSSCYCDGCRARFEKQVGMAVAPWPAAVVRGGAHRLKYLQFRRDNIDRLVRQVHEQASRIRPGIKVTAAVWPNWPGCRDEIGQDWGMWARKRWLDWALVMNYTASPIEFRTRARSHVEAAGGAIPVYPGIGASAPGLTADQVIHQVTIARECGARGFILFNLDRRLVDEILPAMALGVTRSR